MTPAERLAEIEKAGGAICSCDFSNSPEIYSDPNCDWHWIKARMKRLTEQVEKYHVHGTDGCPNCETGRITLFAANGWCIECNPKAYERKALESEE